jgi:radical SAM-linked protein
VYPLFSDTAGVKFLKMQKVSFVFTKKGALKYISHLDLMRLFMRAMRRADLPLKFSEGFSPHPKLSFKRALKLGVESDHEEGTVMLRDFVPLEVFQKKLQQQLPEGISIKQVTN